jgi:Fe-S-cluster containining protein
MDTLDIIVLILFVLFMIFLIRGFNLQAGEKRTKKLKKYQEALEKAKEGGGIVGGDMTHKSSDGKLGVEEISALEEYTICEIKKTTFLPLEDLHTLIEELGIELSKKKLHKLLDKNKLLDLKRETHEELISNEAGILDINIKVLPKIQNEKKFLYVALDQATNLAFVEIFKEKSESAFKQFIKKAKEFYPFKIKQIQTYDQKNDFVSKISNKENILHKQVKIKQLETSKLTLDQNVKTKFNTHKELENTIKKEVEKFNTTFKQTRLQKQTATTALKAMQFQKQQVNELKSKNVDGAIYTDSTKKITDTRQFNATEYKQDIQLNPTKLQEALYANDKKLLENFTKLFKLTNFAVRVVNSSQYEEIVNNKTDNNQINNTNSEIYQQRPLAFVNNTFYINEEKLQKFDFASVQTPTLQATTLTLLSNFILNIIEQKESKAIRNNILNEEEELERENQEFFEDNHEEREANIHT